MEAWLLTVLVGRLWNDEYQCVKLIHREDEGKQFAALLELCYYILTAGRIGAHCCAECALSFT